MDVKAISKLAIAIAFIESIMLFSTVTPRARTQNIYTQNSVSAASINQATEVFQQGKAKAKQKNYRGAIADYIKAIQLNPNEADFYYQRGLILAQLDDKEGAIRDFDDAILRNPGHGWAYFHRAGALLNSRSNYTIINSRYTNYDYRIINSRALDSQAMLDLRTAKNLFAQQGDREGYQQADSLLQYFGDNLAQ